MTAAVLCETCGGTGLVPTPTGSRPCDCQAEESRIARLRRADFPPGYEKATFETFRATPASQDALTLLRSFVAAFIPGRATDARRGVLMTGSVGTGKTHLAVATGRLLIDLRGISVRFVDCRQLYDRLKATFDPQSGETQSQVLKPLLAADLVVIDELGAVRPTDWVYEVTELLIGTLYNNLAAVIVTTNFPNLSPGEGGSSYHHLRPVSLGDRIGARMWSRLQQMCVAVEIIGPDWRTVRR